MVHAASVFSLLVLRMTINENRHMRTAAHQRPEVYEQILAVAEQLFRTLGYGKTTIADIAAALGMSSANIYRYFENKSAINEAITHRVLARAEALVQSILDAPDSAARRLERMILELHRYTCEQYLQESKVHEIVTKAMDEQWSVIDAHIKRLRACFQQVLEEGVSHGEFQPQAVAGYADSVFNAVIPFCHPQVVAERFVRDDGQQAHRMANFLLHALAREAPGDAVLNDPINADDVIEKRGL